MHMHMYNSTCMCDDLYQECTVESLLRQNDRCYILGSKFRRQQVLLAAIITQNVILFCFTVVDKWHQNLYTHTSDWSCSNTPFLDFVDPLLKIGRCYAVEILLFCSP